MKFFAFFGILGIILLSSCSDFEIEQISCKINLEKNTDNCPIGYYCENNKCQDKKTLCGDRNCSENGYCDVVRDVSVEIPTYKSQCFCDSGYYQITANTSSMETSSEIICKKGKDPCFVDDSEKNSKCINGICLAQEDEEYICECDNSSTHPLDKDGNIDLKQCVYNSCTIQNCNSKGTCAYDKDMKPYCDCDFGYFHDKNQNIEDVLTCINPCETQICNRNGTCLINESGNPYCQCDFGFIHDKDEEGAENILTCKNPCANELCDNNGICFIDELGKPYCICNETYKHSIVNDEPDLLTCVFICEEDFCNQKGSCKLNEYNMPYCDCLIGYQDNDGNLTCLENCFTVQNRPHLICDDSSGEIKWDFIAHVFASMNIDEGISVKQDKEQNIFSMGLFDGLIDFNPLYGDDEMDLFAGSTTSGYGFYINKLNNDYTYDWTLLMLSVDEGRNEHQYEDFDVNVKDFIIDSDGNIYIYGNLRGGLKFYNIVYNSSLGRFEYEEILEARLETELSDYELFLIKFDKNKVFQQKYISNTDKNEYAHSIVIGQQDSLVPDNSIYITGSVEGNLIVTNIDIYGTNHGDDYCGILSLNHFNSELVINGADDAGYESNITECGVGTNNEFHNFGNCYVLGNRCAGPSDTNVFLTNLGFDFSHKWTKVILEEDMNICYKASDSTIETKNNMIFVNSIYKYDNSANAKSADETVIYECEDKTTANIYNSYISVFNTTGIHQATWEFTQQNPTDLKSKIQPFGGYVYGVNSFKGKIDFSFMYPDTDYKTSTCKTENQNPCEDGNYSYDLAISKLGLSQYVATKIISSKNDIIYKDFIMDNDGYLYIIGTFDGEVTFYSSDTENITKTSKGEKDIFLLKLDKNLNFIWVETIGGIKDDIPVKFILDEAEKYIYITGHFKSPSIQFYSNYFYDEYTNAYVPDNLNSIDSDIFLWKLLNY